jgi:hypothetical protein
MQGRVFPDRCLPLRGRFHWLQHQAAQNIWQVTQLCKSEQDSEGERARERAGGAGKCKQLCVYSHVNLWRTVCVFVR